MSQVVVVNTEYGVDVYTNDDETDIVTVDLGFFDDQLVGQRDYDVYFKRKLEKIILPKAKEWLEKWIRENSYEEIKI
jgi:hypothetical protein